MACHGLRRGSYAGYVRSRQQIFNVCFLGRTYFVGKSKTLKGRIFICSLDNKEVKQPSTGTGNLSGYLERHFPAEYAKIVVESSVHTNKVVDADGSIYTTYGFKEAAPHHVKFVYMCCRCGTAGAVGCVKECCYTG